MDSARHAFLDSIWNDTDAPTRQMKQLSYFHDSNLPLIGNAATKNGQWLSMPLPILMHSVSAASSSDTSGGATSSGKNDKEEGGLHLSNFKIDDRMCR